MAKTIRRKRKNNIKKKSIKKKNYKLKKGGFAHIDASKVHPASIVIK